MTNPHKNPLAVALGKLAAGKPKNYSAAEKEKRRQRLALVRPKKKVALEVPDNAGTCDGGVK